MLNNRLQLYILLKNNKICPEDYDPDINYISMMNILLFTCEKNSNKFTLLRDKFITRFYPKFLKMLPGSRIEYCSNNLYWSLLASILNFYKHILPLQVIKTLDKTYYTPHILLRYLDKSKTNNQMLSNINNNNDFFNFSLYRKPDQVLDIKYLTTLNYERFLQLNYSDIYLEYLNNKSDEEYIQNLYKLTIHFALFQHILAVNNVFLDDHVTLLKITKEEIETTEEKKNFEEMFSNNNNTMEIEERESNVDEDEEEEEEENVYLGFRTGKFDKNKIQKSIGIDSSEIGIASGSNVTNNREDRRRKREEEEGEEGEEEEV